MSGYTELTSIEMVRNFINNHQKSFVYISRQNCSVCHVVWPKVQELLDEYPQIHAGKVDADQVKQVAGEFLVFTAPAMLLLVNGKELIRENRFVRMEDLKNQLDQIAR
ncbi:thioredoxin family protein [Cytobacillus gottheilii]|uniref:thioredoxin family protein n=1 Tax=Cytobacillus gottheilii TaxID=859144 RepID=UPI0009BBB86A|nr:thioredoxin family protein [Cytobacillus gottheilii]